MTRIRSEDDFLALLDRHFPNAAPGVTLGRGDDAAVLGALPGACVTTDLFVENVHFRRTYFTPADLGHKALAVNLSDVAAMGCRPAGFVLGLICPDDTDRTFWDAVLTGMAALARRFDVPLVGGDLSRGDALAFSITAWGIPGPSGRVLTRKTAAPGDLLCLAGDIGLSRVGLAMLEAQGRAAMDAWPAATAAHLRPHPRVEAGLALAAIEGVTACMDVSDGLARDLPRLLPPGLGAQLSLPAPHLPPEVVAYAEQQGVAPEITAFLGGEDYALLATVKPHDWPAVQRALPQARTIGTVLGAPGCHLNGNPFTESGFDHFG